MLRWRIREEQYVVDLLRKAEPLTEMTTKSVTKLSHFARNQRVHWDSKVLSWLRINNAHLESTLKVITINIIYSQLNFIFLNSK